MKEPKPKFNLGDSVILKDHHLVMTVIEIVKGRTMDMWDKKRPQWEFTGFVICRWDDNGEAKTAKYNQDKLILSN